MFLLKNPIFMFLANFIFVVSHLKIHPAVRSLNFQIVEKSHGWSIYLRMLGKGLQPKTTTL